MIQDLSKDEIQSNCFLLSTSKPYSGKAVIAVYNDLYDQELLLKLFLMTDDS